MNDGGNQCHMEEAIRELYENGGRKLRQMCHKEMDRFGGISQKDYDDFYSRVGLEISQAMGKFNPSKGKSFMEYVSGIVRFSVWKEMTDRNRGKRKIFVEREGGEENADEEGGVAREYVSDVSIDIPIGEEGLTLGDALPSDFDLDAVIQERAGDIYGEKIEKYLGGLSKIQRQIIEMKMGGMPAHEIMGTLGIGRREYERQCHELRSFANISALYGCDDQRGRKEGDEMMSTTTQTMENCKTDRISIASIIKKIERHTIRFDHPLQRESDQWSPSMKGNLVSDILQGNKLHPLIFAEQIINGVPIIWDLDGKQRCTNAYSFFKNGYKITKNIRRYMITYQTIQKDGNGKDVLDENGFPIAVNAEFDIRGKRFSDLPEELRDRFLDYSFNYDQYLHCSEEDIGYHIERYNDGKPMSSPQKGITKLGTEYAEMVKAISNMPFFKDLGGYKVSEFKNGTINRVVVEGVMAANYLDRWSRLEDMCKYLKGHGELSAFDGFEDMVERLEKVVTDEVSDMFNSRDSFLWFGLFARFLETGWEDERFIAFMAEFVRSLHEKKVEGESFDDILARTKSTKDKGIVLRKMSHLEKLMRGYLGKNASGKEKTGDSEEAFLAETVGVDRKALHDDMGLYRETLDCLAGNAIRVESKLLERQNRLSLLAMVVYSYQNDVDLDDWLEQYAKRHTTYLADQKKNYLRMKKDFLKYHQKNIA